MTKNVQTCTLTAQASETGVIITSEKIHHVIAVDDAGICGMISTPDIILVLDKS